MTSKDVSEETRGAARQFNEDVNMTKSELQKWLETDESREVGQTKEGESESVGHQSGRRIIDLREKNLDELTDDDVDHMRKVSAYVSRHLAQRPSSDVEDSRWRYSLMNWGHDPLK